MAIKLGALWLKTSKNGQAFFSGSIMINGVEKKIVCFKNTYKEDGDNKPDRVINEAEPMVYNNNPRKVVNSRQARQQDDNRLYPQTQDDDGSDIPF